MATFDERLKQWNEKTLEPALQKNGERRTEFQTTSGIAVPRVAGPADGEYPEVFIWTTTRDDRVHPGHARKMAAKMMGQWLLWEHLCLLAWYYLMATPKSSETN